VYEALESGAIPVVPDVNLTRPPRTFDARDTTATTPNEYLAFLGGAHPLPRISDDWSVAVVHRVRALLEEHGRSGLDVLQANITKWWLKTRARTHHALATSLRRLTEDAAPATRMAVRDARRLQLMMELTKTAVENAHHWKPLRTRGVLLRALALNRAIGRVPASDEVGREDTDTFGAAFLLGASKRQGASLSSVQTGNRWRVCMCVCVACCSCLSYRW